MENNSFTSSWLNIIYSPYSREPENGSLKARQWPAKCVPHWEARLAGMVQFTRQIALLLVRQSANIFSHQNQYISFARKGLGKQFNSCEFWFRTEGAGLNGPLKFDGLPRRRMRYLIVEEAVREISLNLINQLRINLWNETRYR